MVIVTMHLKPTDLDVLNQEILLLFKKPLPAVVTLISFSSPQTRLCKHAGSSNSRNVKQQRQKSSLYKWETPLTELQHSRLGGSVIMVQHTSSSPSSWNKPTKLSNNCCLRKEALCQWLC